MYESMPWRLYVGRFIPGGYVDVILYVPEGQLEVARSPVGASERDEVRRRSWIRRPGGRPRATKGDGVAANTRAEPSAKGELTFPGTIVYRDTNEGWANSDWGMVEFARRKVVKVAFAPA
jgi:hypothetical protein